MSDLAFDLGGDLGGPNTTVEYRVEQIDHVALGLNRLPWQWRGATNMLALFAIFLRRWNDLEQVAQQMLQLRSIDTANADDPDGTVGAQLDQIGRKVGQGRNGLANKDYRRYIRARIATNNSDGAVEDLIKIAQLIINDDAAVIRVTDYYPAAVEVEILNVAVDANLAGILIDFLRLAKKGGARLFVKTNVEADLADRFAFAGSGPGAGFGVGTFSDVRF